MKIWDITRYPTEGMKLLYRKMEELCPVLGTYVMLDGHERLCDAKICTNLIVKHIEL